MNTATKGAAVAIRNNHKGMDMAAHKLAQYICAWANGEAIQYRMNGDSVWMDASPSEGLGWHDNYEYRIKPAEPERVYPVTRMNGWQFQEATGYFSVDTAACTDVANAALRHAIDAGQVVTREEFDRMCGDRKARDMAVALAACEYINEWLAKDWRKVLGPNVTISTDPHHIAAVVARVKP